MFTPQLQVKTHHTHTDDQLMEETTESRRRWRRWRRRRRRCESLRSSSGEVEASAGAPRGTTAQRWARDTQRHRERALTLLLMTV